MGGRRMRFVALVPDPVTGRMVPFCGAAGIPIEFTAGSQDEANRMAKANRLPPAVLVLPDELSPNNAQKEEPT